MRLKKKQLKENDVETKTDEEKQEVTEALGQPSLEAIDVLKTYVDFHGNDDHSISIKLKG